jgi:hypothetical protein
MSETLAKLNIQVMYQHSLRKVRKDGNKLTGIQLENQKTYEIFHFPCCGLICCNSYGADPDTFRAIINSCLVYDGKLTVDERFRTNDPYMYISSICDQF